MSIEDRVRAATRARAGLVYQVRPLELPDELPAPGRRSRRRRRARGAYPARPPRQWLNWGAPLAAAALVTALALALVLLRQAPASQPRPVAPTSGPSIPASVPRYYVVLNRAGEIVVGDDRTGRMVLASPPRHDFTGVTAAADDRTFVVSSFDNATAETTWYLLRIAPGVPFITTLVPLPIKPLRAQINGLALSQDGLVLAIMFDGASGLQLSTYSVSSGAQLGSWHTSTDYWMLRTGGANAYGLSWFADGRVSFRFDAYAKNSTTHLVTVRTLDVTAAGHDLIADSRLDLQLPLSDTKPVLTEQCFSSLVTPDGGRVICGTAGLTVQGHPGCSGTPPSFDSYSTATGGFLRALYLSYRSCSSGAAVPLWTDASANHVIGLISGTAGIPGTGAPGVYLIVDGNLTPFPASVLSLVLSAGNELGGIAF
jgi:hypothetical protein